MNNPNDIQNAVNELIKEAYENKENFKEAINWADLQCVEILGVNETGSYVALVEEVSPDATEFKNWVEDQAWEKHRLDIFVVTA